MKKLYLLVTSLLLVMGAVRAQFTNLWKKTADGSAYAWLNAATNSNNVVSLAYNPATDKLLVSNRNSQVYIINAATGAEEGTLSLTGLGSESFKFNKIRVTDDGVIYGISLITGAGQCKIYRWANQTANPTLCADFAVTERCGDAFGLAGTGSNTVLYASGAGTVSNAFSVYILNTPNGTNFFVESKMTMTSSPTTNQPWANRTVEPDAVGVNSAIWIKGGGYNARKITLGPNVSGVRTGTVATTITDGTGSGQASIGYGGMKMITLGTGLKYLGFAGGNNSSAGTKMRLLNITDEVNITTFGTDSVTDVASYQTNGNGTGDVAYKNNNDGSYTVFSLSTNNGVWASKSNITMPVELMSFKAVAASGGVNLSWATAQETNNMGFDVERSVDGKSFASIGFVRSKAEQGSTTTLQYSFADNRPVKGVAYYRLKQKDNDGKFTYSSIEKVTIENGKQFSVISLSNPVSDRISLQLQNRSGRMLQVRVVTENGSVVFNRQYNVSSAGMNVTIPVNTVPNGILFVQVDNGTDKEIIRILKQ